MARENRKNNELRQIEFVKDYTRYALGSVLAVFGNTKVLVCCSVEEGKPKWMAKDDPRGWLTAEYSLLPASTNTRCQRERTKISGRTQEIQRLIGRSLRSCLNLELLGERTITIDADVIQADGGTRCASICGGFVALKIAIEKMLDKKIISQNPIIEPIGAISLGIIDNEILVDLEYSEDCVADVDSNIVLTQSGKIIEFQSTAEGKPFEKSQLDKMYSLAHNAIQEIISKY